MSLTTVAFVALCLTLFAAVSGRLERTILTPPLVFTLLGLAFGAEGLGLISFRIEHGTVHALAEFTLALVLFSDAARIDLGDLRKEHRIPLRMLLIGMPLVLFAGFLAARLLPFGLGIWEAALVAAILAPTDAALGQAIVKSENVPLRVREGLNVESGLNDGMALPVVLFFAAMADYAPADARHDGWVMFSLLQVTFGPAIGIIVGYSGAKLLDTCSKAGWMSQSFEGAAVLGPAFTAFAVAELAGGNGFIAAFVAGLVFGNHVKTDGRFLLGFVDAEGQIFILLMFLIFGATLLPEVLPHVTGMVFVYAILSLTVVRMVPIAISLIGVPLRWRELGLLCWFGPRGLASILFAVFVVEDSGMEGAGMVLSIVFVTVLLSVILHGITAAPLTRLQKTSTET